jgi:hypothetical protein
MGSQLYDSSQDDISVKPFSTIPLESDGLMGLRSIKTLLAILMCPASLRFEPLQDAGTDGNRKLVMK